MKIVFMGTPEFALPCLENLYNEYEVCAVFTKPDKRNMRNGQVRYSPIKEYALQKGIEVLQPENIKTDEIYEKLKEINPDLIVVVAYGKIIPKKIIDLPKYGIINVHASLLPKYRGAAPIQYAIMNGDKTSGVTIMYIEEGLDTGDMILKKEVDIEETDNFETLHDKLKIVGAETLLEAIKTIENGTSKREKQDDSKSSLVKPIKKEATMIRWGDTKEDIYNHVRALDPFPTAFTFFNGKRYKIYGVEKIKTEIGGNIGEVVDLIKNKGPLIKVKNGNTIENILKQYEYHLIFNMPIIDLAYRKEDIIYLKIEEGEQYIKDKQNPYYDMLIDKIFILKKESKDEYVMYKKL